MPVVAALVRARSALRGRGHAGSRPLAQEQSPDEDCSRGEHESVGAQSLEARRRKARTDPGARGDAHGDGAEQPLAALDVEQIRGKSPELRDAHDAEDARPDEKRQPDVAARLAQPEENHEIRGEERTDRLEHATGMHVPHQHAVRRDNSDQEERLQPHRIAPQFRVSLGEDEGFANRADQVVGDHERDRLQQQGGDAAALTRLHFGRQGEDPLETAELPGVAHWAKASPRPPGDLSST